MSLYCWIKLVQTPRYPPCCWWHPVLFWFNRNYCWLSPFFLVQFLFLVIHPDFLLLKSNLCCLNSYFFVLKCAFLLVSAQFFWAQAALLLTLARLGADRGTLLAALLDGDNDAARQAARWSEICSLWASWDFATHQEIWSVIITFRRSFITFGRILKCFICFLAGCYIEPCSEHFRFGGVSEIKHDGTAGWF